MNIPKIRPLASRPMLGKLVMAAVLAGMVGGIALPARADEDDWRRERREHAVREHERERDAWREREEWRERRYRERHYREYYAPPAYVYAPPPVIYAPPPPGINLVFPIQIR